MHSTLHLARDACEIGDGLQRLRHIQRPRRVWLHIILYILGRDAFSESVIRVERLANT